MKKMLALAACLTVAAGVTPRAGAQFGAGQFRSRFLGDPGYGLRGGYPGGPLGRPGFPGSPGPRLPWQPPTVGDFLDPAWPGHPMGQPHLPGPNFNPPVVPVIPLPQEKDRDRRPDLNLAPYLHTLPHALPHAMPEFHPSSAAFKSAPASEWSFLRGVWKGKAGGGLLAAIGAGIAGLFGAIFGRNKDKGST